MNDDEKYTSEDSPVSVTFQAQDEKNENTFQKAI